MSEHEFKVIPPDDVRDRQERKKAVITRAFEGGSVEAFAYLSDSGFLAVPEELWGCTGCMEDHTLHMDGDRALTVRPPGCGWHPLSRQQHVIHVPTGISLGPIPEYWHEFTALALMDLLDGPRWASSDPELIMNSPGLHEFVKAAAGAMKPTYDLLEERRLAAEGSKA